MKIQRIQQTENILPSPVIKGAEKLYGKTKQSKGRRLPLFWKRCLVLCGILFSIFIVVIDIFLLHVGYMDENEPCKRNLPRYLMFQGGTSLAGLAMYILGRLQRYPGCFGTLFWVFRTGSFALNFVGAAWVYAIDRDECNGQVYDWAFYYISICFGLWAIQIVGGIFVYAEDTIRMLRKVYASSKKKRRTEKRMKSASEVAQLKAHASDNEDSDSWITEDIDV